MPYVLVKLILVNTKATSIFSDEMFRLLVCGEAVKQFANTQHETVKYDIDSVPKL